MLTILLCIRALQEPVGTAGSLVTPALSLYAKGRVPPDYKAGGSTTCATVSYHHLGTICHMDVIRIEVT